jgi:hypothetical protein
VVIVNQLRKGKGSGDACCRGALGVVHETFVPTALRCCGQAEDEKVNAPPAWHLSQPT